MAGQGVFAVDRGIFDHLIFADEPFTEREAWLWLVGEAAWKSKRIRTPHGMVQLERGQLAHSQRFLAEKWRWDRSRVRNFLALLVGEKMVTQLRPSLDPASTQQKAQVTNILTICNYDKYQFGRPSIEPSLASENERETNRNRPKEEETNNLKIEDGGGTRAKLVSDEAIETADALAAACGFPDPKNCPLGWYGAASWVQKCLSEGWPADVMIEGAKDTARRKRDGPIESY